MASYKEEHKDVKAKFDELDDLFDYDAMDELIMPYKDSNDPDLLWRVAYTISERFKHLQDKAERAARVTEGFEIAKRALEIDETNHDTHKWYSILLQHLGEETKGIKERIADAFEIQKHFKKGLEICPTDPVLMHCLGMWCFTFADMRWYERKIASALFGTPPTSTYEEALKYFEDAEKISPGFYMPNQHILATVLLRLKQDKERAKELLLAVANYDAKFYDAVQCKKEAKETLKKEFKIVV